MQGLVSTCRAIRKRKKPHLKVGKGAEFMMALECRLMLRSLAQAVFAATVEAKTSTASVEHIAAVWKVVKKKNHG